MFQLICNYSVVLLLLNSKSCNKNLKIYIYCLLMPAIILISPLVVTVVVVTVVVVAAVVGVSLVVIASWNSSINICIIFKTKIITFILKLYKFLYILFSHNRCWCVLSTVPMAILCPPGHDQFFLSYSFVLYFVLLQFCAFHKRAPKKTKENGLIVPILGFAPQQLPWLGVFSQPSWEKTRLVALRHPVTVFKVFY